MLQADGALGYDVFALEGPDRVVIDLPGVTVATGRERFEVDDSALVRVRVGQWQEYPTPVARVVLDFERRETWR
ncbi:MAG: AMIN domain-containing protein, partial [Acidobacteria bacterium]|nr:AMIN domain-containing protein [Acidobacteriota bacterium]